MKAFIAALTIGALALIAGASAASSAPSKQDLLVGYDHVPTAADRAAVTNAGGSIRHAFSSINVLAVNLPSGKASALRSQTGVSYVEDDAIRTPLSLSSTLPVSQLVPSPTNGLYGLVTAHVTDAEANTGGAGIKTCVADTGLDTRHPDIAPNLKNTYNVFANNGAGAEGLHATDVFDLGVATTETHATHVAGIIAGADDSQGIRGVAPHVDLLEARVLATQADGKTVEGETSEVMQGVAWLAAHGCKVINMSLGGGDRSQAEEALYNQITQDGTLIVVASGNDSANQVSFPGRYQNVLTVGAVDSNDQLASFSNTGAQLDLVGPGVDNLSSFPAGQGRDAFVTIGSQTYPANPAEFAPATPGVTGPFVNCGKALVAADCGTAPAGTWVALVQRGGISFADKVRHAKAAGAAAVVLYNNTTVPVSPTLGTPTDDGTPWIPTIIVTQAAGQAIVAGLASNPAGTMYNVAMAWNLDSGTSMATPHVTGVAALVLGKNPTLNPHQVEMILEKSATDLGVPNYDTTYGYGVVNAKAALAATPRP